MNEWPPANTDFVLRVRVLAHIINDVCRCHIFTDPAALCSRCDIMKAAGNVWPYEHGLILEAHNTVKSEA